jgi:hypothetical protein
MEIIKNKQNIQVLGPKKFLKIKERPVKNRRRPAGLKSWTGLDRTGPDRTGRSGSKSALDRFGLKEYNTKSFQKSVAIHD